MKNKVELRIKNVMAAVFKTSVEQIQDDSSPETIESWDSLGHMNLVVALEEEFVIEFKDDEIVEILTFSAIQNTVNKKLI